MINNESAHLAEIATLKAEINQLMRELSQLNSRLYLAERAKSQFISNIRNELNDPFSAIIGLSKTICNGRHELSLDKIRQVVTMIYQEAFGLGIHLKNIFAAAEIEAGELYPHICLININSLIQDIAEDLVPMLNIQLDLDLEEDLQIRSDPAKLALIIENLLHIFSEDHLRILMKVVRSSNDDITISFCLSGQKEKPYDELLHLLNVDGEKLRVRNAVMRFFMDELGATLAQDLDDLNIINLLVPDAHDTLILGKAERSNEILF